MAGGATNVRCLRLQPNRGALTALLTRVVLADYGPNVPAEATAWPHRQALPRERIVGSGADIVALQETSPESFESDWAFMAEAGYDCALLSKGRMRPATFWKRTRWALCTTTTAPAQRMMTTTRE